MVNYEKLQNISELEEGDIAQDIFVVKSIYPVVPYSNGLKYRFELMLGDKSAEIKCKYWGGESIEAVEAVFGSLAKGKVVHVKGRLQLFNEKLEMNINEGDIRVLSSGEYDASVFIETSKLNINEMFLEIKSVIDLIKDEEYLSVVKIFFDDEIFVSKLKNSPATMFYHHNFVGGLLEHTLYVCNLCLLLCDKYSQINRDLLLTGALLHGIGKMEQLDTGVGIEYSSKGAMLGDVYMAAMKVQNACSLVKISETKMLKLINMMLSQKGSGLGGKKPATIEALMLSKVKDLDSTVSQMIKVVSENSGLDEDFVFIKEFGNLYLK